MAKTYIGGQAVIEGVMMRSPKSFVVAVRRPDGRMALRDQSWHTLFASIPFTRWPVFRGGIVLLESLHNGFSALKFSADQAEGAVPAKSGAALQMLNMLPAFLLSIFVSVEGSEPPLLPATKSESKPASSMGTNAMMALATAIMLAIFIALPHVLTWLLGKWTGGALAGQGPVFHAVDGMFRVGILVAYLGLISRTDDAKTLFRYHGAEHKAIWAYELDQPLTLDGARPFGTQHPRCGTSFLFVVVGVAVVVHVLFLSWLPPLHSHPLVNQLLLIFVKLPLAFPIAGLAYEIQKFSAKDSCPRWVRALAKPGMWLQNITTIQPTDPQQETALLSLRRALAREQGEPAQDGVYLMDNLDSAPVPAT